MVGQRKLEKLHPNRAAFTTSPKEKMQAVLCVALIYGILCETRRKSNISLGKTSRNRCITYAIVHLQLYKIFNMHLEFQLTKFLHPTKFQYHSVFYVYSNNHLHIEQDYFYQTHPNFYLSISLMTH